MGVMDKVSDNLYVGSLHTLSSPRDLVRAGITHVVSLLRDETTLRDMSRFPASLTSSTKTPADVAGFRHLHIQIDDDDEEDIIKYFAVVNAFVDHARQQGGNVLIHCIAGISRSVTVAVAYLLRENGGRTKRDVDDTIAMIKRRRPIANPNASFRDQLEIYAREGCIITADSQLYCAWLKLKNDEGIPLDFEILPIPDFTPIKKFVIPYDKLTYKL